MVTTNSSIGNTHINDKSFNYLEKAQNDSIKFVTENFQRPEQLENLESVRRRIMVQKVTIDQQLKTSLRYYTNGIRNSMVELKQSSNDVTDISSSLNFVTEKCCDFSQLEAELKEVKSVANSMTYLNKAIELLDQLFEVPGVVHNTKNAISGGEWLLAHKNIRELENIRDTLYLEHLRSTHSLGRVGSDDQPLSKYFSELISLRRALFDKIFEVFDDLNAVVDESPTKLVNALRIIEREEVIDEFWMSKKSEFKGFMPIYRPLNFKKNALETISNTIHSKIRHICESTDRTEKEYINLIFTQFRNVVLTDLKIVKNKISKCFPPQYDLMNFYAKTYHTAIKSEIERIIIGSTEEAQHRYAIALLIWSRDYTGETLFGNKELGQDVVETIQSMGPLLSDQQKELLYNCYIASLYKTMTDYTTKAVDIESGDWRSEKTKPDCYNNLYQTMLPNLLSQTVLSSLQSAGSFGFDIKFKVFKVFLSSIENCVEKYSQAFEEYCSDNFNAAKLIAKYNSHQSSGNLTKTISVPPNENGWPYFVDYTIAISNNCYQLIDVVKVLCDQIISDARKTKLSTIGINSCSDERILGDDNNARVTNINNSILNLSRQACTIIVKDFIVSMQEALSLLFTGDWKNDPKGWSDGFYYALEDFSHVLNTLNEDGRLVVWEGIDHWISIQYIQLLFRMKLRMNDKSERITLGEQMSNDVKRLVEFFKEKRALTTDEDVYCCAALICVDLYRCRDISFVRFDLTKLCSFYSDFTEDHAFNLLSIRGDMTKDSIKNQISEIDFGEQSSNTRRNGVFKEVNITKGDIFSVFTKY